MITRSRFHPLRLSLMAVYLLTSAMISSVATGAVILQYHHVSESTPRITSVTKEELISHLNWLDMNGFRVVSLPDLVDQIKSKRLDPKARLAAITFDDTGASVCTNAWPILKTKQLPFTVFINTAIMMSTNNSQCSWQELEEMLATGLMTVANHSHNHLHMINDRDYDSNRAWSQTMRQDITEAEKVIAEKLGVKTTLFAYPYGEYNPQLQEIIKEMDYVAMGQQSGAVGPNSDLTALPRFPLSGIYASLTSFGDKMESLPFPIKELNVSENPIYPKSRFSFRKLHPPKLEIILTPESKDVATLTQCYSGNGKKIPTTHNDLVIVAQGDQPLEPGRNRYNCTAPSRESGRFYWFSYQWLYLAPGYKE